MSPVLPLRYFSLRKVLILFLFSLFLSPNDLLAQSSIRQMLAGKEATFEKMKKSVPFHLSTERDASLDQAINGKKDFLIIDNAFNQRITNHQDEFLRIIIPVSGEAPLVLQLKKIDFLTESFILTSASSKQSPIERETAVFYWGVVEGKENSTAVINIFQNQISGTIDLGDKTYTLGKVQNSNKHILYQEKDLLEKPSLSCFSENIEEGIHESIENQTRSSGNPDNCVRMYIEVDYDLFSRFGNITDTYNYIAGAFSQVAILYANESINISLNQILIWDNEDPYNGPSTGDYLDQFTAAIGTSFNGDLGHLIGTKGSGGIAYLNALCRNSNRTGYSGINITYQDVPSYSWTINVLTHEIGHNLGSPHTHSCSWNGNSTQIDDCGNQYLANNGGNPGSCYDANNPIIPAGGTIMSYCHLTSGVGMDFNLGFGTQPGDLIRNNVYNASCLSACQECAEFGNACDDGNPCTINDAIDSYCNCTGTVVPDADQDGYCGNDDPDDQDPCVPDACTDCTLTTVSVTLDNYPAETSWQITNSSGDIVFSSSGYPTAGATVSSLVCIDDGCFDFTILDSYGDGICCQYGQGSYTVSDAQGNILASGSEFTTSETTNFCYDNFGSCVIGNNCNDGDDCTTNDVYDANCNCVGTFADADNDGVCDANDLCPNGDDTVDNDGDGIPDDCDDCLLSGTNCNDGDDCTVNDVYDSNCNCAGTFADADNDGVCDADDVCPNGDDTIDIDGDGTPDDCDDCVMAGTSCDDGNDCTINDMFDANCDCVGTFADADNDGVCDADDICPNGDDNLDNDGDGIPDDCDFNCINQSSSFPVSILDHDGPGATSTTLEFSENTQDISFSVSEVNAKLNGNNRNRYNEEVTINYIDAQGNDITYGTFLGSQGSSFNISISEIVQSITISLADAYDGQANSTLSISISEVSLCAPPCSDVDMDGVCDINDICPNGDDTIDDDNDGIPNACDNCLNQVNTFSPASLQHNGAGSSKAVVQLQGQTDPSFTISDLGSKINGNPSSRYIDIIQIDYTDITGNTYNYQSYSGENESSVEVNLFGAIQSITIYLSNGYNGSSASVSISISDVSSCGISSPQGVTAPSIEMVEQNQLKVYPNPTSGTFTLSFNTERTVEYQISIKDILGRSMFENTIRGTGDDKYLFLNSIDWESGIYFVSIRSGRNRIQSKRLVVTQE